MSRVKIDGWAMICWRGTALNRQALIGGTTSHQLRIGREMVEIAGTHERAREYLPGLMDWSLEVERMVLHVAQGVSVLDEIGTLKQGQKVNVCIQIGLDYYEGDALIESVEVSGPLRGKATARVSMRGTGALLTVELENWGFTYTLPMAFDAALAQDSETE
jgi:hypothetical protein